MIAMIDEKIIEFAKTVGKLKKVEMTGWVTTAKIQNPESVAEHSYRAAVMGMLISDIRKLNTERVMRMLLLHDIAETVIGDWDLSAKKKLGLENKNRKEKEAFEKIMQLLPQSQREEYAKIWEEFEERKTEEAKIAYQVEKLEMIVQALEYIEEGYDREKLESFFENEKGVFIDKGMKNLFELLEKRKKNI